MRLILKGSALMALPFFLTSFLFFSKPTHWNFQSTQVQGVKAALLQYEPLKQKDAISVEFLKVGSKRQATLSLLQKVLEQNLHGETIPVHLVTEGLTIQGSAYCLKGGQRLVLDEGTEKTLFRLLREKKSVTLSVASSESTLIPENFNKYSKYFSE